MTISPLDLDNVDKQDGVLIQRGLQHLGFYDGTFGGVPGPITKGAYNRYRGGTPDNAPEVGDVLDFRSDVEVEFKFPGDIVRSTTRSLKARRVQEWLSFHNFRTAIDNEFGEATERTVKAFQLARGLAGSGVVDQATWSHLVAPMVRAFSKPTTVTNSFPDTVKRIAIQHLREQPVELGGQNRGPWVRAYMDGNEGNAWPWCAGFVTFVLKQAAMVQGVSLPISGSFSCDLLATQAKKKSRFVSESNLNSGSAKFSDAGLGSCCIFLVRRTSSDWTHTGFAFDYDGNTFKTIEGNTNDEGSREGYEVCRRIRRRKKKDFIKLG